jgi:hypothetical protein
MRGLPTPEVSLLGPGMLASTSLAALVAEKNWPEKQEISMLDSTYFNFVQKFLCFEFISNSTKVYNIISNVPSSSKILPIKFLYK